MAEANTLTRRYILRLTAVASLTLLSGYFAAIYVLMFYGELALACWKNSKRGHLKSLGISFLASILLARLLFCKFFYGFSCGRAGKAFGCFNQNVILWNFIESASAFFRILQNHLFYVPILWIIFVIAMFFPIFQEKNEARDGKYPLFIIIASLLWGFGVVFLAPFKDLRYIAPCFPVLSMAIPYMVSFLRRWARVFFSIVVPICYLFTLYFCEVEYLFLDQGKRFETFTKKTDVPVFILSKSIWKYSILLSHLGNSQSYQFPTSKESLEKKLRNLHRAFVLFSDEYPHEKIHEIIPSKFQAISIDIGNSFIVFELNRKE
jgi:hypothetical protein